MRKELTEEQWLSVQNGPRFLLSVLGSKATNRKRRLFGCACCRRIWEHIWDERSRAAVELAERFADGLATVGERERGRAEAERIAESPAPENTHYRAAWACANVVHKYPGIAVNAHYNVVNVATWHKVNGAGYSNILAPEATHLLNQVYNAELATQCEIVRDLFCNPFHSLPPKKGKRAWEEQRRNWLGWNGGMIHQIAEVIYNERRMEDLPILADALEDAGCTDAALLDHLRSPGPHVRGCWALDLLLGKK